jgi:predicted metal-binding protein
MQRNQSGPSRLISLQVPYEKLERDLENFRREALELGASLAEIIPANWVEIDERVRLKCSVPLCPYYGKNIYCPPHGPSIEIMQKAVARYSRAILFAVDVIPVGEFADRSKERGAASKWAKKCHEITGRIETLAFGNGYYLATGFSQYSCLGILCGQERCLVLEGGKCSYPLKARPSMEGVGMDVYGLVTKVGWEIYPIYRSVDPKEVSRALSVGIVFIQ